ncbi:MAG: HEPN domain-containing protein [Candidatus Omnitrophica bacterium]|nr:HEPN domain-containing protein [Candidatus Omnitrophota bacterium]
MRKDSHSFMVSAVYDLQTAESLFKSGRYIYYVVFMCHLAIEKMLKAIVAETANEIPPKTHSLIFLIKLAETRLPQVLFDFVTKINNASIVTRYPEDFPTLLKVYPKNATMEYLKTTREVIQCLKKDRRLKR